MKRMDAIKGITTLLVVSFLIFTQSISAFALDERYVSSSSFWFDKGEVSIIGDEESDFYAMITTVKDEENFCFYIYANYTDSIIKQTKTEDIYFTLTFKNNGAEYKIYVNSSGFYGVGESDATDYVNVISNFEEAVSKNGKGKTYIGVELLDKTARNSENTITCECFDGQNSYCILENYRLKLSEEKEKSTANTGKTTTKASSKTSKRASENSTQKSTDRNSQQKAGSNTTKFAGNGANYAAQNDEIKESSVLDSTDEAYTNTQSADVSNRMSNTAKLLLLVSSIIILLGIICVTYSALKSRKAEIEDDKDDKKKDKEEIKKEDN